MADQDDTEDTIEETAGEQGAEVKEPSETTDENDLALDDLVSEADDGDNLLSIDEPEEPMRSASDLEAVYDIPVQVSAVLGKASMQVSQLLKLGRGAVVELDRKVGEAIDIYVNNRLVARGEVVVVEEKLGITMTEIIKSDGQR